MSLTRESINAAISGYFDGCNEANAAKMMSYFTPDAVHYFPQRTAFGALRGARAIADCWVNCVREFGSWWTVDHVIADPERGEAVIEWTHFKTKMNGYLRGDEWYRFNDAGLITEIRAYYACPSTDSAARYEIGGFDYETAGYPLAAPAEALAAGRGESD
jgi:ketosteroid isomerase-like protein